MSRINGCILYKLEKSIDCGYFDIYDQIYFHALLCKKSFIISEPDTQFCHRGTRLRGYKSFLKFKLRIHSNITRISGINKAQSLSFKLLIKLGRVMRKPTFWFQIWSDTNQAVKLQNMARGLKFQI